LGGIPGTVLQLHAQQGKVSLTTVKAGGPISWPQSVVAVTESEQALFSDKIGRYFTDVTFTPDFPRAAHIAQVMWKKETGVDVDGVMSVDPVTLAHLLGAIGPVTLTAPDGTSLTINQDNAASYLLNGIYVNVLDPQVQDAIFSAVAREVFDRTIAGSVGAGKVVDALVASANEGRLLVWSQHNGEQRLIDGTVISGDLVPAQQTSPLMGVYFNATSASKMGYYLDRSVTVSSVRCQPDGSRIFDAKITLTSMLSPEMAKTLPPYVTGADDRSGSIQVNLLLYAPQGGYIQAFSDFDGTPGFFAQRQDGIDVGGLSVVLAPGESKTYNATLMTGNTQPGPIRVRLTPGARPDKVEIDPQQCK
jgi:hypothetical protein